jgi:hypothetical protein
LPAVLAVQQEPVTLTQQEAVVQEVVEQRVQALDLEVQQLVGAAGPLQEPVWKTVETEVPVVVMVLAVVMWLPGVPGVLEEPAVRLVKLTEEALRALLPGEVLVVAMVVLILLILPVVYIWGHLVPEVVEVVEVATETKL